MRAYTGRKREIVDRQSQIEEAAGISLLNYTGKIDWDHLTQSKKDLEAVNPEYKALREELRALLDKNYSRREAQRERANELRCRLSSILHIDALDDEQKVAVRVAVELMWRCKDGVIVRAEKQAKKEAAKNVPSFRPASWQSKRKAKSQQTKAGVA